MKRLMLALVAALCLILLPGRASAQTCSATVSTVDFGSPLLLTSGPVDVTATVSVTCTGIPLLSVVKICPGIGVGSGGSEGAGRLMTGSGGTVRYQLYQDAARSIGWGALDNPMLGSVPAIILSVALNGAGSATRTLYARLFGGQAATVPGSYRSSFIGNATLFSYGAELVGTSNSCTGFAGTASIRPTFDVVAAPAKGCIVAATPLTFPTTGVLTGAVTAQSTVNLTCTSQTAYALQLDGGRNADAAGTRRMRGAAGGLIAYDLFRNAALTSNWNSGAQGSGTGSAQALAVYGRVPPQPTPAPGLYADTVVVTVSY